MKLIVNKHSIELQKEELVNEGEYNVQKCLFEFSQEYNTLTKYATFTNCNGSYKVVVVNNQCDIPIEILRDRETFTLGVYGYYAEDYELKIRYSPIPVQITMERGSYVEDAMNTEKPTPTDLEQLQTQVTNNRNDIDTLKEKCINYDSEIEEIQQDIVEINGRIDTVVSEIDAKIESINNDISRIDGEQETQNTNIQNNTNAISEINGEIETINTNLGTINSNIQTIEGNISTLESTTQSQGQSISALETNLSSEITNRENGDIYLQEQIDGIVASSDVKDIVGTYQELLDYDTSKLGNNDIIKVLQDNTHEDAMTYYRWLTASSEFEYIGQEGPYYTKSEIDTTLQPYVKNTDYATNDKAGVVKTSGNFGSSMSNDGIIRSVVDTYETYQGKSNLGFISKGTLENVITGKGLTTKQYVDDNVETINQAFEDLEGVFTQDQERQDNEITKLQDNIEELETLIDTNTSTGTNTLEYDKAKAYKVFKGEYEGNVEQETTDGRNKLFYSLESLKNDNTSGVWDNNIYTYHGVSYEINEDLTVTVNGTADSTSYLVLTRNANLVVNSSYILQGCPANENRATYSLRIYKEGNYQADTGTGYNFTYSNEDIVRINISNGIEATNYLFKPMIVLASESNREYEKPTFGPSPNPDYPQEVETLKGYNLTSIDQIEDLTDYATACYPYSTGDRLKVFETIANLPKDTDIFASWEFVGDGTSVAGTSGNRITIYYQDNSTTLFTNHNSFKIDGSKELKSVYLYGNQQATSNNWYKIQFTKGTSENPYLPYNSIGIKRIGENLCSPLIIGKRINSNTGVEDNYPTYSCTNYIKIDFSKNNNYIINGLPNNLYNFVALYDENKKFLNRTGAGTAIQRNLFRETFNNGTPQGDGTPKYFRVCIYENPGVSGVISEVSNAKIMLNAGTNALPYTPYQERIDYIKLEQENLVEDKIENCNIDSNSKLTTLSGFTINIAKVEKNKIYTMSSQGDKVYAFYNTKPVLNEYAYNNQRIVSSDVSFVAPIDGYVAFRSGSTETNVKLVKGTGIYDGSGLLKTDKIKVDSKGNVKLVKNWGKVVLDGSESWSESNVGQDNFIYYAYKNEIKGQGEVSCICNYYKNERISGTTTDIGIMIVNNHLVRIRHNEELSIANFKNWLSENKPIVYYKLATPIEINLGTIEPIRSLEGTNNVEVLATLEPTSMSETYAYNIRKELETTKWQFFKAVMGTSNNALPTNWSELLITSNVGGEKSSIDIYKEQLVAGDNDVISPGYYLSANSNLAVVFNINTTNNTINLKTANFNGSNVAVTSQYRIYYR